MLKKLIAILVIAVSISLIAAEKYAILIAGDNTAANIPIEKQWNEGVGDNSEFWNDLYLTWEMLYEKDYKKENIIVIYSDGTDYWKNPSNQYTDKRYRPENITHDATETITQYSATRENILAARNLLVDVKKIEEDDFLYVWVMSHGDSNGIYLMTEDLTSNVEVSYTNFADYFKDFKNKSIIYKTKQ